jgi:2-dehydro-3-deoxyphosphogluconate aldolase/(4S)-4-hydroxy-2-oxoglutarate aldolase
MGAGGTDIATIMELASVIPVLVIEDAATARPLAQALVAGGLRVLEVTMRTPCALEAIAEMRKVEGAVVGAGTVVNAQQLDQALTAGASFIVSPGLTEALGRAVLERGVPFLPGVATASEIMAALELGLTRLKFFPAEASGGVPTLKAMAGPFGGVRFCPTGGVTQANAPDYLALPSVACVGGSWLAGPHERDWEAVRERARAAAALPHNSRE